MESRNVIRLPERRDWIPESKDPVDSYHKYKEENKKFFRLNSEEKLNLKPFGKPNYLVSPTPGPGVAKFKTYLKDHKSRSQANSTI